MSVSATPCGHVFHTNCVSKWIDKHRHCPQCRQPVLTSSKLVKLFFAEEKSPSSAMVLYGTKYDATGKRSPYERQPSWIGFQGSSPADGSACKFPILQRPHSMVGGGLSHWSSQQADVNGDETRIIMDVMQCQMEDLEGECQRLRKRLVTVEDQLQSKVEELSALDAAAGNGKSLSEEHADAAATSQNVAIAMSAASIALTQGSSLVERRRSTSSKSSNIQQSIEELRREYDMLHTASQELRTEIQDLNGSVQRKDRDIRNREQMCTELEERNRYLTEDLEASSRLTADLRVRKLQ